MKNKLLYLLIAAAVALSNGIVHAQDKQDNTAADQKATAEVKKGDDKALEAIKDIYRRLDVGVRIYFDWIMQWGHKDPSSFNRVTNYQPDPGKIRMPLTNAGLLSYLAAPPSGEFKGKNNNAFRINRAYLDVRYKISDNFSARLTSDVDASVTPAADTNAAFHIYLKYAYLDVKKDFGPIWLSGTGGMIETPTVGLLDKISDLRWISQNYIDQSKNIIGKSIDYSADLGVKASLGIMKYATFTFAFSNGGGYKKDEGNSYKAITYNVTVNPMKDIYLMGFGRNEITGKYDWSGKKAKSEYYGYGVAYSTPLIKVGLNHVFPYVTTVGVASYFFSNLVSGNTEFYVYPIKKQGFMILDAYLNFNLGAVVEKAPLLLTGRVVYGLQRGTYQKKISDSELGKERTSLLYALGIGWKVNQNFRILLGGEIQQYFVKKDRVLRYAESRGTDWYSPAAANTLYVGSHDPRDTKRVYVKTEVTF